MNRVLRLFALGLVLPGFVGPTPAAEPARTPPLLAATVTKVNDGDSLEVTTDAGVARVRLSAVDSPEYDQPYASQASAALRAASKPAISSGLSAPG